MNERPAIETIVELSRAMLQDARGNLWAAVHTREDERRGLLKRYFAEPLPAGEAESARRGIEEMLAINEEIVRLGRETQQVLLDASSQLGTAKRASSAYLKNT